MVPWKSMRRTSIVRGRGRPAWARLSRRGGKCARQAFIQCVHARATLILPGYKRSHDLGHLLKVSGRLVADGVAPDDGGRPELAARSRKTEAYVADFAHEVKGPVAALGAWADALEAAPGDPARATRMALASMWASA